MSFPAMPFPTMPDPAAARAHEAARWHPERETLELAAAALPLGFAPGDAAAKPEARPTALIRSRWMER